MRYQRLPCTRVDGATRAPGEQHVSLVPQWIGYVADTRKGTKYRAYARLGAAEAVAPLVV